MRPRPLGLLSSFSRKATRWVAAFTLVLGSVSLLSGWVHLFSHTSRKTVCCENHNTGHLTLTKAHPHRPAISSFAPPQECTACEQIHLFPQGSQPLGTGHLFCETVIALSPSARPGRFFKSFIHRPQARSPPSCLA